MIKCRIWWDDNASAYVISTAYSKDLVGALKQFIPSGDRQYDDQSKHWYVKENYGEFIRTMAEKAFGVGSVSFTSRTVSQQAQSGPRAYGSGSQGAYLNPSTGGTTEDAIVAFFGAINLFSSPRHLWFQWPSLVVIFIFVVRASHLYRGEASEDGKR